MDFFVSFAKKNKDFDIVFIPRYAEPHHNTSMPDNFFIEKKLDVYQCMQNSTLVATSYSTCSLEALALGKPVLLVNIDNLAIPAMHDYLKPDTTIRVCDINDSQEKIVGVIEELLQIPEEKILAEGNGYYAQGHLHLLKNALEEIKC